MLVMIPDERHRAGDEARNGQDRAEDPRDLEGSVSAQEKRDTEDEQG